MAGKVTDHLANERTFLAWIRTALGLTGLGFVLARMGLFLRRFALTAAGAAPAEGPARDAHAGHEFVATGVVFLVLGTAFAAAAGWFYRRNLRAIDADRFEPARGPVAALTAVVLLGGLLITALVLWRVLGAG